MTPYDHQNVFAKILRGEIPCYRVYENQRTFAFMDIMPRSLGHTLVIPKAPARGIFDIPADDLADVARTAQKIAVAAMKSFDADGIILQQFSEPARGQRPARSRLGQATVMPTLTAETASSSRPSRRPPQGLTASPAAGPAEANRYPQHRSIAALGNSC